MNIADYLIVAIIVISAVIGLFRGFLREVIALATWVLAVVIAWIFGDALEPHLGGLLADSAVRPWAARAIVFVLVLLAGAAIGAIVVHFVRLSIFSGMDRFLGFVFGLLRGIVVLGVLVILGQLLRLDGERWWRKSLLVPYGEQIADVLRAVVGDELVERKRGVAAFNSSSFPTSSSLSDLSRPSPLRGSRQKSRPLLI
jgi:membrane protein required for colicin V production